MIIETIALALQALIPAAKRNEDDGAEARMLRRKLKDARAALAVEREACRVWRERAVTLQHQLDYADMRALQSQYAAYVAQQAAQQQMLANFSSGQLGGRGLGGLGAQPWPDVCNCVPSRQQFITACGNHT